MSILENILGLTIIEIKNMACIYFLINSLRVKHIFTSLAGI